MVCWTDADLKARDLYTGHAFGQNAGDSLAFAAYEGRLGMCARMADAKLGV